MHAWLYENTQNKRCNINVETSKQNKSNWLKTILYNNDTTTCIAIYFNSISRLKCFRLRPAPTQVTWKCPSVRPQVV